MMYLNKDHYNYMFNIFKRKKIQEIQLEKVLEEKRYNTYYISLELKKGETDYEFKQKKLIEDQLILKSNSTFYNAFLNIFKSKMEDLLLDALQPKTKEDRELLLNTYDVLLKIIEEIDSVKINKEQTDFTQVGG